MMGKNLEKKTQYLQGLQHSNQALKKQLVDIKSNLSKYELYFQAIYCKIGAT